MCTVGDVLRWDRQVQLRHMTTGLYLCIDDDKQPCLLGDATDPNTVFRLHPMVKVVCSLISTRICAAEMAVRYAALSACRKVRMPSARAEKYMCVIVIR